MIWLIVVSLVYGILVSLDPILFVFIGYTLNVSGIYLGMLGAIWSIVYITASKLLNRVADEGNNRLLILLSLLCLPLSYIGIVLVNNLTAILSYTLHAIATASMNIAISVTMLENTDSELWSNASVLQKSISNFSRGFTLLLLSRNILSIHSIFWLSFLSTVASLLLLPSISLPFERRFYKLSRDINEIGMYIKASSSVLFLDKPAVARYVFSTSWNTRSTVSLYRVLIAIATATALGDYIFTVLPLILKSYVTLTSMWMAYGIAALFSSFIVLLFRNLSIGRRSFAIFIAVARTCLLVFGLAMVRDLVTLATYIIFSSLLYMLVDVVLYNIFIEGSAGFSTANYFTCREIGSIIGSIVGGVMIGLRGDAFLIVAGAIGFSTVLVLI
ncbi:MAG: hypothetical protein QXV81_06070 [Ignisphaera sp.]